MRLFELYKQWWENTNDLGQWESYYDWYYLPYQFCSTPLYVLPFVAFLKNSKARDAIMAFTSFYCMFGGIAVMLYPGDVFIESLGISIQTMVHHGLQLALGVYVTVWNRKRYQNP